MTQYTEQLSLSVSEEMMNRIEQVVEEDSEGYNTKSEYIRTLMNAGESNIAALDPRTTDNISSSTDASHDSAGAAARALTDEVLLDQLSKGKENKQGMDEIISPLTQEFETEIANRLHQLANEESSPVKQDPRGNYWVVP